jgi:hypothetical protein
VQSAVLLSSSSRTPKEKEIIIDLNVKTKENLQKKR